MVTWYVTMILLYIATIFNDGDMVTLINIDPCHHGRILNEYKVGGVV